MYVSERASFEDPSPAVVAGGLLQGTLVDEREIGGRTGGGKAGLTVTNIVSTNLLPLSLACRYHLLYAIIVW